MTPQERYASLVQTLVAQPDVSPPSEGRRFGSAGLKVKGKIFAMLVRGKLVVKLPGQRVKALIAAGEGRHFDANRGRPLVEWFVLDSSSGQDWLALATEALDFVRG